MERTDLSPVEHPRRVRRAKSKPNAAGAKFRAAVNRRKKRRATEKAGRKAARRGR